MEQNQNPRGYEGVDVTITPPQQKRKSGLAVAAMILGFVSLIGLCCCACITFITAPLALILGIISLAKRRDGTGFAVTGIVCSGLCILMIGAVLFSVRDILPYSSTIVEDFGQLVLEQDTVFPAYEQDGTIPEYLEKYTEDPFKSFFAKYDGTFYDVMDVLLEKYKAGALKNPYLSNMPTSSQTPQSSETPAETQLQNDAAILVPCY